VQLVGRCEFSLGRSRVECSASLLLELIPRRVEHDSTVDRRVCSHTPGSYYQENARGVSGEKQSGTVWHPLKDAKSFNEREQLLFGPPAASMCHRYRTAKGPFGANCCTNIGAEFHCPGVDSSGPIEDSMVVLKGFLLVPPGNAQKAGNRTLTGARMAPTLRRAPELTTCAFQK